MSTVPGSDTTAHRVCDLDDVAPGTATRVELDGVVIALVRIDDDVYALGDWCTHERVSLSEGEVLADEREIECWKHGSTFRLDTGEAQCLPATEPAPTYEVVVRDGAVYVELEPLSP